MMFIQIKDKNKPEGKPAIPQWVVSLSGELWTLSVVEFELELLATNTGWFVAKICGHTIHTGQGHGDAAGAREAAERWLLDWTHKVSNTIQIMRHYRASYAAQAGRAVEQACKNIDPITQGGR